MNELGEWLRYARETRGLTLEDAERDTRISRRYLYALESGELDLIPAPVYARGFLRSYAQYLGLDPQEAMARYPRDDAGPYAPQPQQRLPAQQASRQQQQQPRQQPPSGQRPAPFGGSRERPPESLPRVPGSPPAWRRPGPAEGAPRGEQQRPQAQQAPVQLPVDDRVHEPMIGVDIGVPVPSRRLQQDPAAQTRSMVVLGVALFAVLGILALAFLISRLGGGDGDGSPVPTTESSSPTTTGLQTPAATIALTGNGIVPAVVGEIQADAAAAITAAGLVPNIRTEKNDATAGTVINQAPGPGTQKEPGDPVTIIVSEGP